MFQQCQLAFSSSTSWCRKMPALPAALLLGSLGSAELQKDSPVKSKAPVIALLWPTYKFLSFHLISGSEKFSFPEIFVGFSVSVRILWITDGKVGLPSPLAPVAVCFIHRSNSVDFNETSCVNRTFINILMTWPKRVLKEYLLLKAGIYNFFTLQIGILVSVVMNCVCPRNLYLLFVCLSVCVCIWQYIHVYECIERLHYACAGCYPFVDGTPTDCNAVSCVTAPRNDLGYFNVCTALSNLSGIRNKCIQVFCFAISATY